MLAVDVELAIDVAPMRDVYKRQDKRVMGAYRSRFVSRALIWLTVAIVTVLTVALLVMQVMGIE